LFSCSFFFPGSGGGGGELFFFFAGSLPPGLPLRLPPHPSNHPHHQQKNNRNSHGLDQEEVVYERLPSDVHDRHVLLLDPVLGTGHTACRAIQVLLARGVPQSRVLFLCMIATPEGVARVAKQYPGVKIVTSEVDSRLDDRWRVVPGIGQFGDRYWGY
jgi:uracil phosphoribosyltransferase